MLILGVFKRAFLGILGGVFLFNYNLTPVSQGRAQGPERVQERRVDYYGDPLDDGVVLIGRGMPRIGAVARMGTHRLRFDSTAVKGMAFSPDGKTMAAPGIGRTVVIWEVQTGKKLREFHEKTHIPDTAKYSPDGKILASSGGSDGKVILWNPETGEKLQTLPHRSKINSMSFSADSRMLAVASDKIYLWDVPSGELKGSMDESQAYWLAWGTEGKTIISATRAPGESAIRIWNSTTGVGITQEVEKNMYPVAISPDGRKMAAGFEGQAVSWWDLSSGEKIEVMPLVGPNTGFLDFLAFSPDGNYLAACGDLNYGKTGLVRIKNLQTGELAQVPLHCRTAAFSPDSALLATAVEGRIRFWNTKTGFEIIKAATHTNKVQMLTFSDDGKTIVSKAQDGSVCVWEAATGAIQREFQVEVSIWDGALSLGGLLLATAGEEKTVLIYDTATGKVNQTLEGFQNWMGSFAFDQNSKMLALVDRDDVLRLWDVAGSKLIRQFEGAVGGGPLVFSADGRQLATGGETGMIKLNREGRSPGKNIPIRIWDTATGEELMTLGSGADPVNSLAFSPDGDMLVSGHGVAAKGQGTGPSGSIVTANSSNTAKLWHLKSGQQMGFLTGHGEGERGVSGVMAVVFSPDGNIIATGGVDGTIRLWDVFNCSEIARFEGHGWDTARGREKYRVHVLAFSPDGKLLASGGADGTILIWDLTIR